jgi:hypothetical protein
VAKNDANRLGSKPHKPIGLRDSTIAVRATVLVTLIKSLEALNTSERTNILAAAAEFYGLSLTVQN